MALRGEIEVTLTNHCLIRVVKTTDATYADMIQIVQVGLNGPTDTAGVIGSIAHHMDARRSSMEPVRGDIKIWAHISEGDIVVKYRTARQWSVVTLRRDAFLHIPSGRLWTHIRALGVPLDNNGNPEG